MDKNAIKKFATQARRELLARVAQKATEFGIEENKMIPASADNIGSRILTAEEKKQRQGLIRKIEEDGYRQVMEEVAYTWFNRFCALRFMEVNEYLPSHVRVFTNENNQLPPQILTEAIHMELPGLDMEKVYAYKEANQEEELYKYLLITQCNALSDILPQMFERISDYTELLLPDHLLREEGVIHQMVDMIPEQDWQDAVQIIGWLYQYYNAEKKDEVFAALKKNVKITKENIPAATQLFTPDWIVRYMVENSLGRLWVEGHPNDELKTNWKYYLEEAEQEPAVQAQLADIRKEYAAMTPEQIKVIDPCCGSGHILAYLFDVLMQIYESYGFTSREAVASILENNLYGLDIDDRAAQLAYFAVMMKARQYDRRFFSHTVQPKVYAIRESNHIDSFAVEYFCNGDQKLTKAIRTIMDELHDAKEYGSILNVSNQDWNALYNRFDEVFDDISMSREMVLNELLPLVQVAEAMAQKYDVVVTNPPYMGGSGMSAKLSAYVKKNYPDSKADLFAVFIERCYDFTILNGFTSLITMQSWMFLGSYEVLRDKLLNTTSIDSLLHLGIKAFEEIGNDIVQTVAFVLHKQKVSEYCGTYFRLLTHNREQKRIDYLRHNHIYYFYQQLFRKIPGYPIAYWVGQNTLKAFEGMKTLGEVSEPKQGIATADNNRFLRLWSEIPIRNIAFGIGSEVEATKSNKTWFPYQKGGDFRKWYGNNNFVVFWKNNGETIKHYKAAVVRNPEYQLKEGLTWTWITTGYFGARYSPQGSVFDVAGSTLFANHNLYYLLGYMCSCVADYLVKIINPTINFSNGVISKLPICVDSKSVVEHIVQQTVEISRKDWDSYETSWDFECNPLVQHGKNMRFAVQDGESSSKSYIMAGAYYAWKSECENRFQTLKSNEEELNRIFIDIYGLQDELTPEVEDKNVTVYRIFDCKEDIPESMGSSKYALTKQDVIKSFISYAVGCMFGRYSLDKEGLVYAGGNFDEVYRRDTLGTEDGDTITFGSISIALSKDYTQLQADGEPVYLTFPVDADNVIPICDDDYFEDDMVGRFVEFVRKVYGDDTLDENLRFIADALGGKGQPKEVIRNYFLNDFYKDHCKTYQKRPIYWLFDSGKKNGFKALIYMHRYQPDTIARIRTDYVHEQQSRYRTAIEQLEKDVTMAPTTADRVRAQKALTKLKDQDAELRTYEEKIHHLADQMISIDLDDGVKHNYEIFADVLAKIK